MRSSILVHTIYFVRNGKQATETNYSIVEMYSSDYFISKTVMRLPIESFNPETKMTPHYANHI